MWSICTKEYHSALKRKEILISRPEPGTQAAKVKQARDKKEEIQEIPRTGSRRAITRGFWRGGGGSGQQAAMTSWLQSFCVE